MKNPDKYEFVDDDSTLNVLYKNLKKAHDDIVVSEADLLKWRLAIEKAKSQNSKPNPIFSIISAGRAIFKKRHIQLSPLAMAAIFLATLGLGYFTKISLSNSYTSDVDSNSNLASGVSTVSENRNCKSEENKSETKTNQTFLANDESEVSIVVKTL